MKRIHLRLSAVALVLLLLFPLCVAAESTLENEGKPENECDHAYQLTLSREETAYVSRGDKGHEARTYYLILCRYCGAEAKAYIPAPIEAHSFRVNQAPVDEKWGKLGDSRHEYHVYFDACCDQCGEKAVLFTADSQEQHHVVLVSDAHVPNENFHIFTFGCEKCDYTEEVRLPCGGNDTGLCVEFIQQMPPL